MYMPKLSQRNEIDQSKVFDDEFRLPQNIVQTHSGPQIYYGKAEKVLTK